MFRSTVPGKILGQAGPTHLRPASAGVNAFLHEMGHVIGIGTIWTNKGLLTGANTANPLNRVTVASLNDLGYVVNLSAAEPYSLPNLRAMAEAGLMTAHADEERQHALPIFAPAVLPAGSLVDH